MAHTHVVNCSTSYRQTSGHSSPFFSHLPTCYEAVSQALFGHGLFIFYRLYLLCKPSFLFVFLNENVIRKYWCPESYPNGKTSVGFQQIFFSNIVILSYIFFLLFFLSNSPKTKKQGFIWSIAHQSVTLHPLSAS